MQEGWGELPRGWEYVEVVGVAVDSRDDVYVGEVSWTMRGQHLTPPRHLRSLQKLARVSD